MAGITVALVLIPQSMAYAQLAGMPAYYGLYAAFMPPMVSALFGSSRQLQTGPVAIVSILTAAALEPLATAGTEGFIAYAITLSLMVGIFELCLGMLRLGALVNFLAHPVIVGFTNAAAIIIATSQLSKVFGVHAEKGAYYAETIWNTLVAIVHSTHWPTLGLAVLAFSIIILVGRFLPRLPYVLIAVVVTTLISYFTNFERIEKVKTKQIVNSTLRDLVIRQISARKEFIEFDELLQVATQEFDATLAEHGLDNTHTLDAKHRLDSLRLKKERRKRTIKSELDELKAVRFRQALSKKDGLAHYYLNDELPKGLQTDGHLWHLSLINSKGELVLSGGGAVVGKVPQGLPAFRIPEFNIGVMVQLIPAAITIALLGFMEAISIAKAMATRTRQRVDANQELIGQGLGNIVGSLFQSYPVSGSFSRSAVNIGAGAITGFSSVVTTFVVVAVLLFFTPLLYHLPQATLAAVIMMAVAGLVHPKAFVHIWKAQPYDGFVAAASFFLTLALAPHLDYGIIMGAGMALGLYLFRTMRPRVAILGRHKDGTFRDAELYDLETCPNISMIRFDGSLYFANTSYFEDKVLERSSQKPELRYVVVVSDGINYIDATGEEMLTVLVERLESIGIEMLFAGLKRQALDVLKRSGFYDKAGSERFFRSEDHALRHIWVELGEGHAKDCPLSPQSA
ncbi:MAG: STAS domain-containing protein [Gammaproteobacteria bacterium]|nr:STAS domain-containing protein [Gammaproteobacteria bacterium]